MATDRSTLRQTVVDRNTLKQWFSRGNKPLAAQFAAWIDSFWHKEDEIQTGALPRVERVEVSRVIDDDVKPLVLTLNKPAPEGSYLQIWRFRKNHFRAMDMTPRLPTQAPHIFPVIPIQQGATTVTLTQQQFDELYKPPNIRGSTFRSFEDWAGLGKRHNPINGSKDTKVLLKFSIAEAPTHADYNRGIPSAETLKIQKFAVSKNGMNMSIAEKVTVY